MAAALRLELNDVKTQLVAARVHINDLRAEVAAFRDCEAGFRRIFFLPLRLQLFQLTVSTNLGR